MSYIIHKSGYSLRFALDKMAAGVGAAVSIDGSLGIELLEALLISSDAAVTPDLLALQIQSRTHSVKAVSSTV